MKKALLVIGDLTTDGFRPQPSINRFIRYKENLIKRDIEFALINYENVLLGSLPSFSAKKIKVMLFFPYLYWNINIERYDKDERIYGDDNFGREYRDFFIRIDRVLKRRYAGKILQYVNSPGACVLDRDKKRVALKLATKGILSPRIYNINSITQLNNLLKKKGALYIKPPFGAMGKGITYLTPKRCYTNFLFKNNKIISRPYDYNWSFIRIKQTERDHFLKILIKKKFLFEEAIDFALIGKRRFDIRAYVIYAEVPYVYARSAAKNGFVTNWSQGGKIEDKRFLRKVIGKTKLEEIISICTKVARILGLNYTGIDVILDRDYRKTYILEAHSFPGYERGFNLMRFLADKIALS
jgi:glutathione synthase/RimK-type ligase-like ATP-grasp enzyme